MYEVKHEDRNIENKMLIGNILSIVPLNSWYLLAINAYERKRNDYNFEWFWHRCLFRNIEIRQNSPFFSVVDFSVNKFYLFWKWCAIIVFLNIQNNHHKNNVINPCIFLFLPFFLYVIWCLLCCLVPSPVAIPCWTDGYLRIRPPCRSLPLCFLLWYGNSNKNWYHVLFCIRVIHGLI